MSKKVSSPEDEKRIKVSTLAYAFFALLVVVLLVAAVFVYGTHSQTGANISQIFSKVVPMPAAIINMRNFVLVSDLEKNTSALVNFYQSPDYIKTGGVKYNFSSDDGKKQIEIMKRYILSKMIQDKAVEILASKRNISVSQNDVKNFMDQKMKAYATQDDVTAMLKSSYGWTLDDFTSMVVTPSVRLSALQDEVVKNELNKDEANKKITAAKDALTAGTDFSAVAKQFSDGQSKNNGGELGWVEKTKIIPELQEAIFGQNPPKKTDIIESSIGFHLIDIEGKKKENNSDVVQFRQIFVAKKTFADWLSQQLKGMRVMVPLGEFSWNSNDEIADFADKNMQQFEKDQMSSPTGITAAMFQ